MDKVFINGKMYLIDYANDKEFKVGHHVKQFISLCNKEDKDIISRFNMSATSTARLGHGYASLYRSSTFVDYRDSKKVKELERKASLRQNLQIPIKEKGNGYTFYLRNPIIYKKNLRSIDRVGAMLYFTCAIKCKATFNGQPHFKKFIPSNGARYPFVPTIHVRECFNIPDGIYMYDVKSHSLIRKDDLSANMDLPHLVMHFQANVKSVMERYPNGIAYRDLLFDLGHLLQTIKFCAIEYNVDVVVRDGCSTTAVRDLEMPEFFSIQINTKLNGNSNH